MGDRYLELNEAADGLRRTGVPFIAQRSGRLMPAGCADTPGMFYLIPRLAEVTGLRLPAAIDLFFATIVSLSAIAGIVGFLALFDSRSSVCFVIGVILLLTCYTLRVGDVYSVEATCAIAVIPWALVAVERFKKLNVLCLFGLVAGLVLGSANIIRDQAATPVVLFVIVLILTRPRLPLRHRGACAASVILGLAVPLLLMQQALTYRDTYLRGAEPNYSPPSYHHVFWHTAYLGLGFVRNDTVSGYRDELAIDKVREIDPSVVYCSAAYDSHLRPLVLDIILHHPSLVILNLFAKLGVILVWLLIFANLGLGLSILYPKPIALEAAFWAALFCASFPALIAVPARSYLLGFCCIASLYCVVSLDFALEAGLWHRLRAALRSRRGWQRSYEAGEVTRGCTENGVRTPDV